MIREYLRHSRVFRAAVKPVLKLRAKNRLIDPTDAVDFYKSTVRGGTLVLAPKNLSGTFEVSATSDIASRVVLSGCYEPEVTAALDKLNLQNGIIVNIGANIGFYSVYLATAFPTADKILAIEPNPEAFELLKKNIARNSMQDKIEAVQACIGNSLGSIKLSIVVGKPEYSSIGGIAHPGVASFEQISVDVPVAPLASIVGPNKVALLFVDTEGAEAIVFQGARDVLVRDKPILFFECSDTLLKKFGSSTQELDDTLQSLGYIVRNGLCTRLRLQHPFEGEGIAIHKDHPAAKTSVQTQRLDYAER
jgi:FkbM family methyltransferase